MDPKAREKLPNGAKGLRRLSSGGDAAERSINYRFLLEAIRIPPEYTLHPLSELGIDAGQPCVVFCQEWDSRMRAVSTVKVPDRLMLKNGFTPTDIPSPSTKEGKSWLCPDHEESPWHTMASLARELAPASISVWAGVEAKQQSMVRLNGNVIHAEREPVLVYDPEQKSVFLSLLEDVSNRLVYPVLKCGEEVFLARDGTVVKSGGWGEIYQNVLWLLGNDLSVWMSLPIQVFNSLALLPETQKLLKLFDRSDRFYVRDAPLEKLPPAKDMELQLRVEAYREALYRGRIYVKHLEQEALPLDDCICEKLIDEIFLPHQSLWSSRNRFKCLVQALQRIAVKSDDEQVDDLMDAALSHSAIGGKNDESGRFLKNAVRKITGKRKVKVMMLNETGWVQGRFDKAAVSALMIAVMPTESARMISVPGEQFYLPKAELPSFIRKGQAVCKALGHTFLFNGSPLQTAPVEFRLEASPSDTSIDWFELKAEVFCGSVHIPQNEWTALITGQLILATDNGMVIPELTQSEALERLRQLFSAKPAKGRRKTAREGHLVVNRLDILEWLHFRKTGFTLTLPPEIERIVDSLLNFRGIPQLAEPQALQANLRDYQKKGFEWLAFLYEHRFGACLADDMGLGKTLQAITFLAWIKEKHPSKHPSLVIVPPSLLFNWASEVKRFCPGLVLAEFTGAERHLPDVLKSDVILTTYELVRRDIEKLVKHTFNVVVLDEVQALKNADGERTQATNQLKRRFTLCMTGTPMENRISEFYSIMNLAVPGIFGTLRDFRELSRNGLTPVTQRARPFLLRRTKQEMLKELPPKVESDLYLEMTEEQKAIYTRTVAEVRAEVLEAFQDKTAAQAGIVALAALTRLRQVCISPEILGRPIRGLAPKMEHLSISLAEIVEEGNSALCFSQFTRALDVLENLLRTNPELTVLRLDGSTPAARRKDIVERFQNSKTPCIFLISLKAGGSGLNLTRAQYVFHMDPWWNPAVEQQASDRAHRMGQTQTVFIQRLIMRHSIEEKILQLRRHKQELFNLLVEEGGQRSNTSALITREDMEFLMS